MLSPTIRKYGEQKYKSSFSNIFLYTIVHIFPLQLHLSNSTNVFLKKFVKYLAIDKLKERRALIDLISVNS